MRGRHQSGGGGDGAHEGGIGEGLGAGDHQRPAGGPRATPGRRAGSASRHPGGSAAPATARPAAAAPAAAAQQGRRQALHVVLALGAVDHGGVQHHPRPAGGEQRLFAGQHAAAVGVGPAGIAPGAAQQHQPRRRRRRGQDGGGMAGMGAGNRHRRIAERAAERRGVGEVGEARGWWRSRRPPTSAGRARPAPGSPRPRAANGRAPGPSARWRRSRAPAHPWRGSSRLGRRCHGRRSGRLAEKWVDAGPCRAPIPRATALAGQSGAP